MKFWSTFNFFLDIPILAYFLWSYIITSISSLPWLKHHPPNMMKKWLGSWFGKPNSAIADPTQQKFKAFHPKPTDNRGVTLYFIYCFVIIWFPNMWFILLISPLTCDVILSQPCGLIILSSYSLCGHWAWHIVWHPKP